MLAGVLLVLCVQPFRALAVTPAAMAPVILAWLLLMRFARRWAVPGALAVARVVNLAAISAALAAGPEAHPDPDRRWIAGVTCGFVNVAFGPLSALVAAVAQAAPEGIIAAIAGLALIGTFAASATAALADPGRRDAAAVTFLAAASGLTVVGVGAAFWALVAGGLYLVVLTWRPRRGGARTVTAAADDGRRLRDSPRRSARHRTR